MVQGAAGAKRGCRRRSWTVCVRRNPPDQGGYEKRGHKKKKRLRKAGGGSNGGKEHSAQPGLTIQNRGEQIQGGRGMGIISGTTWGGKCQWKKKENRRKTVEHHCPTKQKEGMKNK